MYVAVDSWTDSCHLPVLGFAVGTPHTEALLWDLRRAEEAQTSAYLVRELERTIADVESVGCKVVGLIADNAANVQKALAELGSTRAKGNVGCMAHGLNLLLKDILGLFQRQLEQCSETVQFFKVRHDARRTYIETMQLMGGNLLKGQCATRWGSAVDMLRSMVENKRTVQQAALTLRGKDVISGNTMWWLWADDWWRTLGSLVDMLSPLRQALDMIQRDRMCLSQGMPLNLLLPSLPYCISCRCAAGAPTSAATTGVSDQVCARRSQGVDGHNQQVRPGFGFLALQHKQACCQRREKLVTTLGLVALIFDQRYRGRNLHTRALFFFLTEHSPARN